MKTKNVDQIAKTERLTKEILLREVLPMHNHSAYFEQKKEELLSDFATVSGCYDLDERVVIYCFIRLFREGKVRSGNFMESFDFNRINIMENYVKHYCDELEQVQQLLWQG